MGENDNGCVMSAAAEGAIFGEEEEEEDKETLKKRISSHPLYALLIDIHINCLKVGLGDDVGGVHDATPTVNQTKNELNPTTADSDLDEFMEVYCKALSKLKEEMEEPLQESEAFIDAMYVQLRELAVAPAAPVPSISKFQQRITSSSSEKS
ncbi:homeobox protein knotted-1-like 2 [Diospyros lotus]|uniref:homeobox protein knotted-1-like 2 n=1 Tax=Diospyros lotus TaxID=55363 RepID=UPI0022580896|nr:homeobox protein knotted-1-like 2 [Diospyros lotus]